MVEQLMDNLRTVCFAKFFKAGSVQDECIPNSVNDSVEAVKTTLYNRLHMDYTAVNFARFDQRTLVPGRLKIDSQHDVSSYFTH